MATHHKVKRFSTAFALKQYTADVHPPLMCITILLRLFMGSFRALRDADVRTLRINEREVHHSFLFRGLDMSRERIIDRYYVSRLSNTMRNMHVHSARAEDDKVHTLLAPALRQVTSIAEKIRKITFAIGFAFLVHFPQVSLQDFVTHCDVQPADFARRCWDKGIVPVTPRFGQGSQKAWHSQLLQHLEKNNKTEYEELVLLCHSKMVLNTAACDALAAIFAIPPNTGVDRMRVADTLLGEVPGFGSLAVKNTLEGTIAHGIFRPTLEELKSYPNGQGAGKFWSSTGLNRQTAVTAVKTLFGRISIVHIAKEDACFQGTVSELKFDTECIDERLMQYWACCQGRVLKTRK